MSADAATAIREVADSSHRILADTLDSKLVDVADSMARR
jgi:hypothetical protein